MQGFAKGVHLHVTKNLVILLLTTENFRQADLVAHKSNSLYSHLIFSISFYILIAQTPHKSPNKHTYRPEY